MPKYVTQKSAKILSELEAQAAHMFGIMCRRANNCPNLPSWFTSKPTEYYKGSLEALYGAIETILRLEDAYNGYSYTWPEEPIVEKYRSDWNSDELHNYYWEVRPKK